MYNDIRETIGVTLSFCFIRNVSRDFLTFKEDLVNGTTHEWVAKQAIELLPKCFQAFLQQEWDWLEVAVTMPDSMLRYDTTDVDELEPEYKKKFPVHRYNCDEHVPHGYGLVGQTCRYFDGTLSFIQDCRSDAIDDPDYYYGQTSRWLAKNLPLFI